MDLDRLSEQIYVCALRYAERKQCLVIHFRYSKTAETYLPSFVQSAAIFSTIQSVFTAATVECVQRAQTRRLTIELARLGANSVEKSSNKDLGNM